MENRGQEIEDKDTHILIVDDEPDMCWALEYLLKEKGLFTATAGTGRQAVQLVKKRRFKWALLDAKLPDMEGLELAGKLQKIDPLLSIVIVSGYFYKDDIEIKKAMKKGLIDHFVAKPFNHDEILCLIDNK